MKEQVRKDGHPKKVTEIQFSVFGPEEVAQMAEIQVSQPGLYDATNNNPIADGCLDRRMGTSEKNVFCQTCKKGLAECPGHFGYIQLSLPVYNIGYFDNIVQILHCICKSCSRILISEEQRMIFLKRLRNPRLEDFARKAIASKIAGECKRVKVCHHCHECNGRVKKIGVMKIIHEKYREKESSLLALKFHASFAAAIEMDPELKKHIHKADEDLNPTRVLELFERISDEDCELLGLKSEYTRPEHFLLTALPVPPLAIRPSVAMDAGTGSNEDDLTMKLHRVLFINDKLQKSLQKGDPTMTIMQNWGILQLQVAMYINSDLPGVPATEKSQRPIRGLCQRLKGKGGRFRGNLSGKRVDFSSRTVISPDPNLAIDEVAVPEHIAKILTYPEMVNAHNIARLRENVSNGPDLHPGANYVQSANGLKRFLKYGNRNRIAADLKYGDIVERHLHDGDFVLFNRQPSLHKLSIMCHKVRVRPWRTFRLNECVCTPYNADFDGDEMNLHVPQTEEARAEAALLMNVCDNLVSPRNGDLIIAATQDFITSAYLISQRDFMMDRSTFVQMCFYFAETGTKVDIPSPAIIKPTRLWTGKQLLSLMMRPNAKSEILVNLETKCRSYTGPLEMCPNDGYFIVRNSQIMCGVLDKNIVGGNKNSIFYMILRAYGPQQAASCMNRLAKLSARFIGVRGISFGLEDVMPSAALNDLKNALIQKGYEKCDQYIQEFSEGKLHCQPGCSPEETLEAVINHVLSQIREDAGQICLQELNQYNSAFVMAISGAKGSNINISQMVACVGQQTVNGHRIPEGFIQRTLPHFARQSKSPAARGFVAHSFINGLSPTEFFFHAMAGREGLVDTAVKTADTGYMQRRLMKALEDLSIQYDHTVRSSTGQIVQFKYGDDALDPTWIESKHRPADLDKLLAHTLAIVQDGRKRVAVPLSPREIEATATALLSAETHTVMREALEFLKVHVVQRLESLYALYDVKRYPDRMHVVHQTLAMSEHDLSLFIALARNRLQQACIEAGTAVGALAAQSIGEPGTQMTLKTFHFAGVASMNITLGVPRLKEIINASKKISTPIITAKLVNDKDLISARIVKGRIEKTLLGQVADSIEEVLTPNQMLCRVKLDLDVIHSLQLDIDARTIMKAIEKLAWRPGGGSNQSYSPKRVEMVDERTLIVYPPDPKDKNDKKKKKPSVPIDELQTTTVLGEDHDYGEDADMTANADSGASGAMAYYLLQRLKHVLKSIMVYGISGVNRAVISEMKENTYHLLVEGNDLRSVLNTEGVCAAQTRSNHIMEVREVLGIEAARATIMYEIQYVMSSYGMSIDPRHVQLLADTMTFKGEILGITRFGIAKMKDSVLMLASFEKTIDHLFDAGYFGKKDLIQGVSECIIVGNQMPIGTGILKILQKIPKMKRKDTHPIKLFDL